MKSILKKYDALTSVEREKLQAFGRSMASMHFTADQVDTMMRWKLSGDEVFIKECESAAPDNNENRKRLKRMFLEDEKDINDEGYRIVRPLQRKFSYYTRGYSIGVTVIAVRCRKRREAVNNASVFKVKKRRKQK